MYLNPEKFEIFFNKKQKIYIYIYINLSYNPNKELL